MKLQVIKADNTKRIENGALQINDDWPGLYLRGDDAIMRLRPLLEWVLELIDDIDPRKERPAIGFEAITQVYLDYIDEIKVN